MADQLGYFVDMNQQFRSEYTNTWNYSASSGGMDSDYFTSPQDQMFEETSWNSDNQGRKASKSSQSREKAKTSVCSEDGVSWSSTPPGSPYNASPGSSGVYSPPPPREQFQTNGEYFRACVEYDSGASTVAIDNKIEQAMDLVKSHLMFAVREEVEVLKEQIKELLEKNSQLEYENSILKSSASPETLAKIQQNNPPPPPSNS